MVPAQVLLALILPASCRGSSSDVAEWVQLLADPSRTRRQEARDHLLALGEDAREELERAFCPAGFEARFNLDYILGHLPRRPKPITVRAGTYQVGNEDFDDSGPEREVGVPALTIDDVEVTCFEYYRFARATRTRVPSHWREGRYPYGEESYPVHSVSFAEAEAFAHHVGGRLPEADEWEIAALSGGRGPFPWGANPARGFILDGSRLRAVGASNLDRSPTGMLDAGGSLSEWVVTKEGPAYRGGHYRFSDHRQLRVTRRPIPAQPAHRSPFIGFRVADRKS